MRALVLLPILSGSALVLLTGCHDDTPVSPNEKTAAPARVPGEDPKAPPNRAVPSGVTK
jgi:hypothetical protein